MSTRVIRVTLDGRTTTVRGSDPSRVLNVGPAGTGGGGTGTVESVNGVEPAAGDITLDADDFADGTTNHVFTALDDTKLAGIATGATANDTDANLKARANHTGSQAISTVTGLQTALDGKETAGAAAAAQAASQPVDSDLTAIAALTTTSYGRALLALADAAALRSTAGLILGTDVYSKAAVDSGFQPLDSDLTAIAALTTTSYGRAFLALADAAAARTALSLGTAALISSTAGGDLSGTLPSPTVAKINGVAVTGTPAVGDVPTATSTSAATWQAPAAGSPDGVTLGGSDDYTFSATAAIDTLPSGWSFDRTGAGATQMRYQEGNGRGVLSQIGTYVLFQGIHRTIPASFATALFRVSSTPGTGNEGCGPYLRASASGKAAHMTLRASGAQQLTFYSSGGSVGSDFTGAAWAAGPTTDWYYKIVKNSATSWTWYAGPSPVMLDPLFSAIDVPGATNGFTPDQIGFGLMTAGGGLKVAAIDYVKFT